MNLPKPLFEIQTNLGEGPIWDASTNQLYWVDINAGRYFKATFPDGPVESFEIGQKLGSLALRTAGGIVMAAQNGFGFFEETTQTFTLIDNFSADNHPEIRLNDGAVDSQGRFFAGTMDMKQREPLGKLYRLNKDLTLHQLEENIYISNGMGWSLDNQTFFYIDTLSHSVAAYDYEVITGNIANKRIFIQFSNKEYPDGMTIDSEGGFWIAFWGAAKIGHFDANGQHIEDIPVPALQPTSCCFGGPDMTTLFITSAATGLSPQQMEEMPLNGRLFMMETNVRGREAPRFGG